MNRIPTVAALFAAIFLAASQPVYAITFFDILDFPSSFKVTDTLSGNQINYSYAHDLTALPQAIEINSAQLSLTHSGNLNAGPRREIWVATTLTGALLGTLSASGSAGYTDTWSLDVDLLRALLESGGKSFTIGLSEQTAFNREKIGLIRSRLEIDYAKIPQSPETGSLILMLTALATVRIRQRISKKINGACRIFSA